MIEGARNFRRMGVVGAAGAAVLMALGGCGTSEPVNPTPTADATLKPVEMYDHRVAVQSPEGRVIVCFTDEMPVGEEPFVFVAEEAYCPDPGANDFFMEEKDVFVSPFRLNVGPLDTAIYTPQWKFRERGKEIPPVYFGD